MTLPTTRIAKLTGHNGPVHALTYSSAGSQYILTGSTDRLIRLFNPQKAPYTTQPSQIHSTRDPKTRPPGLVQTYAGHAHEVLGIAVSSSNAHFISAGGDKHLLLWDVSAAKVLRRFDGHAARINACAWGGDGREEGIVVSGSFDTTVKFWDVKSNSTKALMSLGDAKDSVSCIEVVGPEVLVGSVDGRVRGYDVRMGRCLVDVVGAPVTSIMSTRTNDAVLVGSLDSTLRLLEKSSGRLLQAFKSPEFENKNYRLRSKLFENDSMVLSGSEDGRIFAWDTVNAKVIHQLWHDEGMKNSEASKRKVISSVKVCPTRREWCSAAGDGTVAVWGEPK